MAGDSHFGSSDALLTLFIALAGLFVLRAHDYGTRREYIWSGTPGWYDQHDAFYLPLVGFGGVVRPGPDVTIYQRVSTPEENDR